VKDRHRGGVVRARGPDERRGASERAHH
jgi:hypothetical protein